MYRCYIPHLGDDRSWRVPRTLEERLRVQEYRALVQLFADHPGEESLFSIHNMCQVCDILSSIRQLLKPRTRQPFDKLVFNPAWFYSSGGHSV